MPKPSDIRIPVGYPNDDLSNGAGMSQRDYDEGQIGWDDLRTIDQLLVMPTFNLLEPEFQRCFIAMAVAAWIEAGLLHGVGTGWRSEATQQANWERDPKQFAPVSASLHMRKPPRNVAYAIDTVPGDSWKWMHANCARFHINALDHIPNEKHHIQPIEFPNSGSAYNTDATRLSALAAQRHNLPYLGTLSLAEWLARNDPIKGTDPTPAPTPPPSGSYLVPDIQVPNEIIRDAPPSVNGAPSDPTWLWATAYQQWQIERPGTFNPQNSGIVRLIQWGTNNAVDAGMINGPKVRTDGVYDQATAEGWNRWLKRAG